MHLWVIGAGGMLGSAIAAHAVRSGVDVFAASPVDWANATDAAATLAADARRFADSLTANDWAATDDWAVVWAAGSSVVSSSPSDTAVELHLLEGVLDGIAAARPAGRGVFFLSSSAGGVYAGSSHPPFDAATTPVPISPYGELKLAQERAAISRLRGAVSLVIGRLSNLYGPGQDPSKGQGLIPALCAATVRRRPLNLYVSMDTVRDYLYVADAAAMAWNAVTAALQEQPFDARIRVLASGQPTTVAQVIATVQNVAHRRVPLALGTHPSSQHQAIDLRLTPSRDVVTPGLGLTTLPSGIKLLFNAMVGT